MRKKLVTALAVGTVSVLALTGCGSDDDGGGSGGSGGGSESAGKVGVILPDATTSPRWEANDRPSLKKAFDDAGIESDIQNAGGDKAKFGTLCDSMINEGVAVLMIVNLDSDSGAACLKKATQAGIKSIDYDRLTLGGGASYYVSFDNVKVGALMGEGLEQCLSTAGKTSNAQVVYVNGDPTDNNAALFKQGYDSTLQPLASSGKVKILSTDVSGFWDAKRAGTAFEASTPSSAARSTASCPRTTRWPAASSPPWPATTSRARSRSPARTPASRACSGSSPAPSA